MYIVKTMGLLFFFIDGIGIAPEKKNGIEGLFSDLMHPLDLSDLNIGSPSFFDNGCAVGIDAVLGVKGEPQSATGQTTIFTGINTQQQLGYHLPAFPNSKLIDMINSRSLMNSLKMEGISVTSANMYSEEFFQKRSGGRKNKFPVSTLVIQASSEPFRMYNDYLEKKAVFADITNHLIKERGWDIDLISETTAADHMVNILDENDFVFFEYFMTDLYGHRRNVEQLKAEVNKLNSFLSSLIGRGHDVMVISDHGNAEDLSTGGHTKNPVPFILFSESRKKQERVINNVSKLDEIYHQAIKYFN